MMTKKERAEKILDKTGQRREKTSAGYEEIFFSIWKNHRDNTNDGFQISIRNDDGKIDGTLRRVRLLQKQQNCSLSQKIILPDTTRGFITKITNYLNGFSGTITKTGKKGQRTAKT
jgi:hypothetical protein